MWKLIVDILGGRTKFLFLLVYEGTLHASLKSSIKIKDLKMGEVRRLYTFIYINK